MIETCRIIKKFYEKELNTKVKVRGWSFSPPLERNDERFTLSQNVILDYLQGEDWREKILKLKAFYQKHLNEEGWNKEKIKRELETIEKMLPIWGKYFIR